MLMRVSWKSPGTNEICLFSVSWGRRLTETCSNRQKQNQTERICRNEVGWTSMFSAQNRNFTYYCKRLILDVQLACAFIHLSEGLHSLRGFSLIGLFPLEDMPMRFSHGHWLQHWHTILLHSGWGSRFGVRQKMHSKQHLFADDCVGWPGNMSKRFPTCRMASASYLAAVQKQSAAFCWSMAIGALWERFSQPTNDRRDIIYHVPRQVSKGHQIQDSTRGFSARLARTPRQSTTLTNMSSYV